MTALDLIKDALAEIGVYNVGEPDPPDEDVAVGLRAFNRMVGSANTNRQNLFTTRIDKYTLTSGQREYTIGPDAGADFNADRPLRIVRANLFLPTSPVVRRKLAIWDDKQWGEIKLQEIYTYPRGLYNDGAFPLSTLYFHPIPDGDYDFEMYTWQTLAGAAEVTTEIAYPPGYEEFWLYGLSVRLAPLFGRQVSPDTREMWRRAEASVQGMNVVVPRLDTEPGLQGDKTGLFNWLSRETE